MGKLELLTTFANTVRYLRCLWMFHQVYKMQRRQADSYYVGLIHSDNVPSITMVLAFDRKAWELAEFLKESGRAE